MPIVCVGTPRVLAVELDDTELAAELERELAWLSTDEVAFTRAVVAGTPSPEAALKVGFLGGPAILGALQQRAGRAVELLAEQARRAAGKPLGPFLPRPPDDTKEKQP